MIIKLFFFSLLLFLKMQHSFLTGNGDFSRCEYGCKSLWYWVWV